MRLRPLAAASLLMFSSVAAAAAPAVSPRDTVTAVAQAISENYFDIAKGDRIADELRAEAAAGKFDRYSHSTELATALAQRLQPSDAHFNVLFSDQTRPQPGAGTPGPPVPRSELARRDNYGFHQTDILPGNIGYIALGLLPEINFSNPEDPARQQADAALALTRNTDAMIIDLRHSPGGSPAMVGYLVSAFTKADAPIYNVFHWRIGERAETPEEPYAQPRLQQPLYFLTSPGTASAAEGLSYTLQAAKRATVVGEPSAGGANPGGFVDVGNGFAVFVSVSTPVNPITGTNWEGTGVIPDHRVPAGDALIAAEKLALQTLLDSGQADAPRVDQRWALQALQPAPTVSRQLIASYVGTYLGLNVTLDGDQLVAKRTNRAAMILRAMTDDEFAVAGDPSVRIRFVTDETNSVMAAELITAAGPLMSFARGG